MAEKSPAVEVVSSEQQSKFKKALLKLLGVNAVSTTLGIFNEVVVGHSALGFTQVTMEATDTGMAAGLGISHKQDKAGNHHRASRIRQSLYGLHFVVAGVGIAEGARLMSQGETPSPGNIAISGLVGVINTHIIRHNLKHRRQKAHVLKPSVVTAQDDPIEVVQDVIHERPDAETAHQLNIDGTTAIATTNLIEAGGGVAGPLIQMGWEQGSATAAIVSSAAVMVVMGRQVIIERRTLKGIDDTATHQEPICLTEPIVSKG